MTQNARKLHSNKRITDQSNRQLPQGRWNRKPNLNTLEPLRKRDRTIRLATPSLFPLLSPVFASYAPISSRPAIPARRASETEINFRRDEPGSASRGAVTSVCANVMRTISLISGRSARASRPRTSNYARTFRPVLDFGVRVRVPITNGGARNACMP